MEAEAALAPATEEVAVVRAPIGGGSISPSPTFGCCCPGDSGTGALWCRCRIGLVQLLGALLGALLARAAMRSACAKFIGVGGATMPEGRGAGVPGCEEAVPAWAAAPAALSAGIALFCSIMSATALSRVGGLPARSRAPSSNSGSSSRFDLPHSSHV